MQRHIKWQREQIQLLQEQITDLKSALEETNNQLNLIRHRWGWRDDFTWRVRIDGTDRIDYAYEKNGGRVLTGRKWYWYIRMTCRWTTEPPSGAYFAWSIQQADPSLAINVHIFDISQLATYGEGILLSDGLFKSNVYSSSFTASESRILQYRSH